MGNVQSIDIPPICIPTDEETGPDESPVYRNIHCYVENGGQLIKTYRNQPESETPIDILRVSATKYADCDCVGERERDQDGNVGPYKYISYSEFYKRVLAFGRGLLELGLNRGDRIGIYSNNSIYWQMACFGAQSVGIISVPIYDSLGKDAAQFIVNHAEVKVIFTSLFKLANTLKIIPVTPTVTNIVVMSDKIPPSTECSLPICTCKDILEKGYASSAKNNFVKPEEVAVIMYTSGSTGDPKGCVLTGGNIVAGSTGLGCVNLSLNTKDTFLSFLPLAHIYGMAVELMMYTHGTRVAFAQGPTNVLLDDIQAMQPTIIVSVPRILNRIAEGMKAKIDKLPFVLKKILYLTIPWKAGFLKRNEPHSLLLDSILFKDFRAAVGGKIRLIVNGGAPIMKDVFEFLQATITPNIIQGYGLTEVCAGLAVQELPVFDPLTVGASSIACEVKLRKYGDYSPQHDPPEGELLVRGPIVFKGYYKQPELTQEAFDGEWFKTGDICRYTKERQIQIIDRAKQLVKLSQGEYISLTTITDYYSNADCVSFIYIYADSNHDYPLAVVFPKKEKIKEWEARGITDVTQSEVVKKEIVDSLLAVHKEMGMRGFERITNIIVETDEPTVENGFLTPSMKPQLGKLKNKYSAVMDELYRQLEEKKKAEAEAQAQNQ
ncbi:AMP-binding enzyme family protein [Histomonas meleagridis]|uniref:AMP-binding enzyme family protein n=1 Tax=Histomonas meleagridis TaxID=135588 RepID=UPI00355991ED|nr:AMP-binding enzyme family protein [Histomonas meleagridis]KAH0805224.1 AMP-binding enzyme family protein [Histomonas meleagridis]